MSIKKSAVKKTIKKAAVKKPVYKILKNVTHVQKIGAAKKTICEGYEHKLGELHVKHFKAKLKSEKNKLQKEIRKIKAALKKAISL